MTQKWFLNLNEQVGSDMSLREAFALVRMHGDNAEFIAASEAKACRDQGDWHGHSIWTQVLIGCVQGRATPTLSGLLH